MVVVTGYEMLKSFDQFSSEQFGFFTTGFVVSFIVALLAVVTFIKFVQPVQLVLFCLLPIPDCRGVLMFLLR
ncbi:hypothetical protein [Paenibacillus silviterrae]|uniref:hypothetical protein n=1 Tax=Paenibacillus silviterrae TaxID=3242194 RepID=UPI0025438FA8|nr:hypothetical protein [Paenibacillus chinjuensis]